MRLLDAGTNRGYGNAIFPAKRRCIIGKDQGTNPIPKMIKDWNRQLGKDGGEIIFCSSLYQKCFLKILLTSMMTT